MFKVKQVECMKTKPSGKDQNVNESAFVFKIPLFLLIDNVLVTNWLI
jgi:hypothetical protein